MTNLVLIKELLDIVLDGKVEHLPELKKAKELLDEVLEGRD